MGPAILGRYALQHKVGAGGTGEVWLATDQRLDQPVALKRISFGFLTGGDVAATQQRAIREARLAAMLRQHPHVVALYDFEIDRDDVWLVMEYLPSLSLRELVLDRGPMSVGEAAIVGGSVASALLAAHSMKLLHRDVSPGNVLIGTDGRVKLTDFGIARLLNDAAVTRTGTVVGTVAYLAPELVNGHEATFASDVFSLGATLYLALEGISPYGSDDNVARLLSLVSTGNMRPPERAGPLVPLLQSMLQINPATRPDPATICAELARYATGVSPGSRAHVLGNTMSVTESAAGVLARRTPYVPTGLEGQATAQSGELVVPARKKPRWTGPKIAAVASCAAIVMLAAGAVAAYGVTRLAAPPAQPSAKAVLTLPTDRRLFDTCRLFDLAAMRPFGTFTTSRGGNLDSCEAHAVAATGDILVRANPLDSGGGILQGAQHKVGSLPVIQGKLEKGPGGDNDSCESAIVLPDTGQVRIRATPYRVDQKVGVDLCRLAGATVDAAARRILRSGIPVSGVAVRDYRLASRDACALVDQSTLAALPGLPTTNTSSDYASWGCGWSAEDGKPNLLVRFVVDDVWNLQANGTAMTVAGKNAYQKTGSGEHNKESCTLVVEINRAKPDSGKAEAVHIVVDTPQPAAQQCAYAAKVAANIVKHTG